MAKKILKIGGIVLLVLLVLAFTLPLMFKGKILNIAKKEINGAVNARVDFMDVNISFFRSFPRLAVGLEGLEVVGVDEFSQDTLLSAKRIDIALNLFGLLGEQIEVHGITIDGPRIHAIVTKEGKANWDIAKSDEEVVEEEQATEFNLSLKKYRIRDAYIRYDDRQGDMSALIEGLNHSGSGDFTADLFTLVTQTEARAISFTYTGIPYLVSAKASLKADIEVDNPNSRYSFKTDDVALNDLQLATQGYFQFVNDTTYGMDISFNAPSTEFKTLLSLIPAIYKTDFDKIKTSGKAVFNGFVKGEYNAVKMPAFQINLNVEDGFFQYPDLPQPVKNIAIVLKVDNPDGVLDNTVVDISKGHVEFGNDPFDFRLLLKKPETVQDIDASIKGKLNLAQVTEFVKLEGNTQLSGMIDADASAKGHLQVITQQKPGPFSANGYVHINNLHYSSADLPVPVKNGNIQIRFDNPDGVADHTVIHIPQGHVELGSDPLDFNVRITNPATVLHFDGAVKGRFNLANVAQFTALEPGTSLKGQLDANVAFKGNKAAIDKEQYDKINLSGNMQVAGVDYVSKDYPDGVQVSKAALTFNPTNITLNNLKAEYLKSVFTASGSLDNAIGYALKDEPIAGTLQLHADQLNLNAFMGVSEDTTAATATTTEPFVVPKNISFTLNAAVDKLIYDKTTYNNLKGAVVIRDQTVYLRDVQMDALDGKLGISGSYATRQDPRQPAIDFSYDIKGVNIEKAFYAFNTVQQLMPIGKFLSGTLNSQMSMQGRLGSDMSPVLTSLTGKGNFALLEGALKKFAPVEKIAQTLNVVELSSFSLKDVKGAFDFANGKVLVKPFKVKVKDIAMEIGGTHGLDQSMNYAIDMKLPRAMLGTQGNNLINNLAQQASSKGIPVKLGDYIDLNLKMGGSITNPQLSTDFRGTGGSLAEDMKTQAQEFAQQKIDSAKTLVAEKTQELKDTAKNIATQAAKDLLKDVLTGNKDSVNNTTEGVKKDAEKAVKNTLQNLLKKKKE